MTDRLFGLPEEAFRFTVPRKGLITKTEIRVLSLAKLDLGPGQTLWDVGAGSGSVGIEAARLVPDLSVWAIEKDEEDYGCLEENIRNFDLTRRMNPVFGKAPEALRKLPKPHRVFVGGSGGKMADLLDFCWGEETHPGIVCNLATVENLAEVLSWAKSRRIEPDILHVQVGRGQPIVGLHRIEALNPVWIVSLFAKEEKKTSEEEGRA
ncbi:MAG: precorrin-6Y C5,15-methyltransferase (decarboxylating) subunit CbiT [Nitrospiraceae bacterium]|jgi:precorrin-6Y C5,15-methyltransferase (decarboxylating)|nr:precorrin-6Y C5,15-methyltransferase (decarboxylating) subunit CbiT [Nitrospiraceae bacterium]